MVVEFALLAMPLFGIIFAIIEFGWAFNQQQDVRYGAREGARIAAVSNISGNATPNEQDIASALCARMDSAGSGKTHVSLTSSSSHSPLQTGDTATITVAKKLDQLTGFYGPVLNSTVLKSSVSFRLEQKATWSTTGALTISGGTVSGGKTCS